MTRKEKAFVRLGRVAHLATADIKGRPLNVPICYALDGEDLYPPIDEKPKTISPLLLKRILNIRQNPHVSVVVDIYDEHWERLAYVIIAGKARVLTRGKRHQRAVACLQKKHPQYRAMAIHKRPIIHITPMHCKSWGGFVNVGALQSELVTDVLVLDPSQKIQSHRLSNSRLGSERRSAIQR